MLDLIREETEIAEPLLFDYNQLTEEHREAVQQSAAAIKRTMKRTASDIGAALESAKSHLDHGQWMEWLRVEFNWTERTAENAMNAARLIAKNENFSILSDSVQYMIGAPSTPEPAQKQVLEMAENGAGSGRGGRVTVADARQVVAKHRPPSIVIPIARVQGKCKLCRAPLTDPESVARGYGPECADKMARAAQADADDEAQGVAVVGNGPLDDDDKPALPADLVALGCRLAVDAGFYHVRFGSHRETYASLEGAIAWCRRITGANEPGHNLDSLRRALLAQLPQSARGKLTEFEAAVRADERMKEAS